MNHEPPAWVHRVLSPARFDPYLKACGGDAAAATRLYWWNVEVSAAFYGPLHCLEVAARNALHRRLCQVYGRETWWDAAPLNDEGHRKVERAYDKLHRRGVLACTADDVVAELTFGFWVSLLSRRFDRSLWIPALHAAFPHYSGRRSVLHRDMETLLRFRNRVMHYEPIHDRPLTDRHALLYRLLGYIDPGFAVRVRRLDRVPEVLARRGDVRDGNHRSSF